MKFSFLNLSAFAIICISLSCNTPATDNTTTAGNSTEPPSFDLNSARKAIDSVNARFMSAVKTGDSAALGAIYTSDGSVLPPNSESVTGTGISAMWGSVMRMGVKEVKLTTDDLTGDASLLAETGKFELYSADQKVIDKGKYIVVWKPENGTWKMYRDIFNSSMPASH